MFRCDRDVELLERLHAQHLDQVSGEHLRMAGDVEDPLLGIERGQLAAELGQRVDHPRGCLAHAGPERRAHPDRAGADHRDVADLVEVVRELRRDRCRSSDALVTVSAAPSSAPSARSTEHEMHVNVGVSRSVYELDSVVRRRCTRSRKSAGLSVSNATTNSWSSSPNE